MTETGEPKELFLYRYPGFQHESMLHYRAVSSAPTLQRLLRELNDRYTFLGKPLYFNHVIATRYRDHADTIGWHSDKMRDISPGTPILSLSLGAARELGRACPPAPGAAGRFQVEDKLDPETRAKLEAWRRRR